MQKIVLDQIFHIYYPVYCQKKILKTLFNFCGKFNVITSAYTNKLGLQTWKTEVKV